MNWSDFNELKYEARCLLRKKKPSHTTQSYCWKAWMAFHVCMLYIRGQPLPDAGTSRKEQWETRSGWRGWIWLLLSLWNFRRYIFMHRQAEAKVPFGTWASALRERPWRTVPLFLWGWQWWCVETQKSTSAIQIRWGWGHSLNSEHRGK